MTSLLKIGMILMAVTVLLVLVHPADADDDVKRKRVIIKIPHRVKHIYHHHTKKVHVHKKKPKPKPKKKTPHKHVHVVVEEEEIVQPIKSWKTIHSPFKKGTSTGWEDWKASPSGFKQSVRHPDDFGYGRESTHLEEDFAFEDDHDTRESRTYGRPHNKGPSNSSGGGGKRVRKGGRGGSSSYRSHEEPSFEASYEIYHHHDEDDFEGERPRRKPKSKMSTGMSAAPRPKNVRGGPPSRSSYGKTTRRPRFEDKYREPDEYDELYDRGPAYPEHKEHPSWHERSRNYAEQEVASEQNVWNLPKVPEVKEYIDDVNDTPDPGVRFQNGGGFYPSQYNPITTITSSVVQNAAVPSAVNDYPANAPFHDFAANNGFNNFRPPNGYNPGPGRPPLPQQHPIVPTAEPAQQQHRPFKNNQVNKKPKKNPGYLSQVSQTSDGLTVGYKSHVGHSSDIQSPSSSYQSVSYGIVHTKK